MPQHSTPALPHTDSVLGWAALNIPVVFGRHPPWWLQLCPLCPAQAGGEDGGQPANDERRRDERHHGGEGDEEGASHDVRHMVDARADSRPVDQDAEHGEGHGPEGGQQGYQRHDRSCQKGVVGGEAVIGGVSDKRADVVLGEGTGVAVHGAADPGKDIAQEQEQDGNDDVAKQAGTRPGSDALEDDDGGEGGINEHEVLGG